MSEKSLRSRTVKAVIDDDHNMASNGTPAAGSSSTRRAATTKTRRNPPYLPTRTELLALGVYPVLLTFGTLFSVFNPQARGAPYDPYSQSHVPGTAPSYFARKDNLLNVLFVKKGWAWFTAAFFAFLFTHPALGNNQRRAKAAIRWALVTGWWVLVTQWCFGPALIDRGFRYTGGKCEVARLAVVEGDADKGDALTAVACKAAGGRWSGGHDISGHVFLLMLGSWFLVQEAGWVLLRAPLSSSSASNRTTTSTTAGHEREERTVVMADGAVKGAGVEAVDGDGSGSGEGAVKGGQARRQSGGGELGLGGKFVAAVVALSYWMLLMTAIYFHTWFEKVTGFLVAFGGMYAVYIVPRFVPQVRSFVGLPGI
ncbi:inositol phospholipid synthesis and fat-storage-inducing TM-domain-containing protein [Microdochium bolleyi]|uniref:Acyl-coenzyme A diphosphatase SCS3 n=1 Tax=Microdochium bolleyi TaxID=196109 RepID=A0A136JAQ0_9PEZI|nr:inositol phospholipid synthesis and fat-storage-inducing TM-domain-containing protein [Microdochium bolleyi]